ncbi:hypothetical protein AGR5A_Lc90143 [Agrobacterium genomosp. 5 str. CFBP 6626]|nr:hypothetical protein AGR5A_Lc90143 [Agrobacterium genomosp. 5 str. CFBP 6626]
MVRKRRRRRLQRHAALLPRRAGGIQPRSGAAVAGTRPFPPGLRRFDAARSPWHRTTGIALMTECGCPIKGIRITKIVNRAYVGLKPAPSCGSAIRSLIVPAALRKIRPDR